MTLIKKVKDIIWIFIVAFSAFILMTAVWIRRTYGILSEAMTNESFLNFLQDKRSVFLKYVIIPTIGLVFILFILQWILRKKFGQNGKLLIFGSFLLLIVSFMGAGIKLDAGAYFTRQYRLGKEQWYDTDKTIAHALGEIDGTTYTNSREALENSYQNGIRLFECDFSMTADNQVVACHDWEFWNKWCYDIEDTISDTYIPSLDEFMQVKIKEKYTALSGKDILLFMKEHPDVYIITDTKTSEPETLGEPFVALVNLAKENGCEDVLERFVVQIYYTYMYDIVQEIYPFPNYIFTLYQEGFSGQEDWIEELAKFCMFHNIDVITMWFYAYHDSVSDICNRYDIQIFVHTVNDEDKICEFFEKGVGVYTDVTDTKGKVNR